MGACQSICTNRLCDSSPHWLHFTAHLKNFVQYFQLQIYHHRDTQLSTFFTNNSTFIHRYLVSGSHLPYYEPIARQIMGQSSSRLGGPQTPTETNLRSDTINPNGESNGDGEGVGSAGAGTSSPHQSRRTSMRQSLRALLKPSDSSRNATPRRVGSNPGSQLFRRRSLWRSSRRLSKAAENVDSRTVEEETVTPTIPEELRGEEVDASATPSSSKGKGREEEPSELPKPADDHQVAIPSSFEPPRPIAGRQGEPSTSMNIGTGLSGSGLAPNEDEVVISPTTFADKAPAPEIASPETNNHDHHPIASMAETTPSLPPLDQPSVSNAPPPSLPTQNQNENQQQFPPPGTLVIVQALVHTADIPQRRFGLFNRDRDATSFPSPSRPDSSSSPTSSTSTTRQATPASRPLTPIRRESASAMRSQNRLSSFIPRPSGGMTSRPPSFVSNPTSAGSAPVSPSIEESSANSDTTANTSGDQTPDLDRIESTTSDTSVSEPAPNQPLSASSIDVLGTLLRYVS